MFMRKDIVDLAREGIAFDIPEKGGVGLTVYNGTGSAMALGDVAVLTFGYASGSYMKATTPATSSVYQYVVVALEAIASTAIGRVQIIGECEAYVEGTTDVAAGDFLEVTNTKNEFYKDGSSRSTNSAAIAVDAQATNSNVLSTVFLLGERVIIAAS